MTKGIDVLFMYLSVPHPDPEKDRGRYKLGDMVDFRPFRGKQASGEVPPTFFRVSIPDMTRADLEEYFVSLEEYTETADPETQEVTTNSEMLRRKRFNFDPTLLPAQYKNQILSTGRTEIRWKLFKTCMTQRTD